MSKMVTRTVVSTKVNAMIANLDKKTLEDVTLHIAGTFEDEGNLIKAIKKAQDITVCAITDTEVIETLYGLDENKFIELAVELDPVTRKPLQ